MPSSSSAAARLAAACVIAAGGWIASGTLTLASPSGPRIGLLPPVWVFAVILGIGAIGWSWWRSAAGPIAAGAVLAVLPWLPAREPAAFLAWSRPLSTFIAAAAIVTTVLYLSRRLPSRVSEILRDERRAPLVVATLSLLLYGGAAWRVSPMIPGGDEPHYLVITQSLLYDFDLRIENNHRRGDYQSYHPGDLKPDFVQRGVNGEIYSVHMPGISALVAPAFLVGGYPATVVFLIVLGAAAGAVLWRLAWRVTGDPGAAWFGWAAAALSVPVVFHAFTLYPDSPGMLLVLVGMAGLLRASRSTDAGRLLLWVGHGTALAALPWLHSRFAMIAGLFGVLTAWRLVRAPAGAPRSVVAFLSVPALSALAWFWFFHAIYGSPDPRAQYGGLLAATSSPAYVTSGIGGLLLDPQFGLLPYAPAFAAALAGIGAMLLSPRQPTGAAGRGDASQRLVGVTLILLLVAYLSSTTTMRMWWGGWSAPARFLVPLLPPLGIAAAVAWQRARTRVTQAVLLGSLGLTIATSGLLVWVGRGRLAYNIRQSEALWLDWLGPLANLSRGVPTFLRTPEPEAWIQTVVWVSLLLAAWLIVRGLEGPVLRRPSTVVTAVVLAFASAGMAGLSFVWWRNGLAGVEPTLSQVQLLHAAADGRGIGVTFAPLARVSPTDLPSQMVIVPPERFASAGQQQLTVLPGPLPAGEYALEPTNDRPTGRVTIGIGPEHVPVRSVDLTPGMPPIEVRFPVAVRAIAVHGDAEAADSRQAFVVRPQSVLPARHAGPGSAVQARRYGTTTVYFLDDRSFPEPPGIWVGGACDSTMVLQPDAPRGRVVLRLRNAPVKNQVTLEAGGWRAALQLAPGEERRLEVPLEPSRGVARLRVEASSGFRPSEHEPGSDDGRFLGIWMEIE